MIEKKFIDSKNTSDYEVWTNEGWVETCAIHKTIPYRKWFLETESFNLICADNHIVFLQDDDEYEIFIKELNVGDSILTEKGPQKVINLVELNDEESMYDLELSETSKRKYYTNGILSHNTNFLRFLTKQIKEKKIIYIPPDFAINISNPEFITFFLEHANSILIIEDAENILKSRKGGGNQVVANLLSISDGLLGDGLKLQIVCTFNSEISEIDSALLREGRLIAEYKFHKLELEKTKNLLDILNKGTEFENDDVSDINEEMTLAEIYNYHKKRFVTKKNKGIGFNN